MRYWPNFLSLHLIIAILFDGLLLLKSPASSKKALEYTTRVFQICRIAFKAKFCAIMLFKKVHYYFFLLVQSIFFCKYSKQVA